MHEDNICLSTVTPVYAGATYLPRLVEALAKVHRELAQGDHPVRIIESIFVVDDATDDSLTVLEKLAEQHPFVTVITLSRNFGQHAATAAGILHSVGDWVVTMDEDLQHPPDLILTLLRAAITEDNDLAYGKPDSACHGSLYRDFSSKAYKWLLARLSGNPNVALFNSFRVIRGSLARAAAAVSCHDMYLDAVLSWFTKRVGTISLPLVDERFQQQKKSGYNLYSLLGHARRLLMSSDVKSLRIGATVGIIAMFVSLVLVIIFTGLRIFAPEVVDVPGWTSILVTMLFFSGLLCLLVGIVLENISILLRKAQGKPAFFVVDRSKDARLRPWPTSLNTK